jgi:hypothetical protein
LGGHLAKQEVKSNAQNFSYTSRIGFDIGIIYGVEIAENIVFQPEAHLIQKGYKIDDIVLGENFLTTLNYLEVPLTLKVLFGDKTNLYVQAGPSIGFLMSGNVKQDDFTEDIDFEEASRLEIGGILSAGVSLGMIVLDARYLLGLTGTVKDVRDGNIYNRGFGAGLSIIF